MIVSSPKSFLKSFIAFIKGYWYVAKCHVMSLSALFVKHTGKVETCYGGVQTTLFGAVTFFSFSKHHLNNISNQIDVKLNSK